MNADEELAFLARVGRILQEWQPAGTVTRDEAYELVRARARVLRASASPPATQETVWDTTGDATLDRILEVLEERVDPMLAYVPAAGPARRRTTWHPA